MFDIALTMTLKLQVLMRDWRRLPLSSFFYYPLPNTSADVGPLRTSFRPIDLRRPSGQFESDAKGAA